MAEGRKHNAMKFLRQILLVYDVLTRQPTLMLLVRFVRGDGKMKARLGKVVFNISVWVAVIVSLRGGL